MNARLCFGLLGVAAALGCRPSTTAPSTAPGAADAGATAQADPSDEPYPSTAEAADPKPIAPTTPHAFGVLDMLGMDRISGYDVSPDGTSIVFVRRVTDMEADKGRTDLWTVPVAGGQPKRLTRHAEADFNPRFSKDGKTIFFLSTRGGAPQVWKMPAAGGAAAQVTDLPLPVSNLELSPDGSHLAFSMDVFIDCADLKCTADRLAERGESKRSGMSYDQLFVRHWDTLKDGRRTHLFVRRISGGDPVDLTAGVDGDVPSRPFGDSSEFTFTPDGKSVVFAARVEGAKEAWSTNFDLYTVATSGGKPRKLTTNPAWDTHPTFSPDGKTLVWTAMKTPGYEADRFAVMAMDWPSGEPREVAKGWDRSAMSVSFADGGKSLLVVAQNLGHRSLFRMAMADGAIEELVHDGTVGHPVYLSGEIVFARHDLETPTELYAIKNTGGEPRAITSLNAKKLEVARMGKPEQFKFKGAKGDDVYGWLVKPADFDANKKYPIAFLIHGGPQGSFGNMFHYRWNAQTYAGAGYAVVMIDFHGSTGYGQRFTDSIGGDWGGKPLTDLKKGLAYVEKTYPWVDGNNACALGASYGGFMINWIAGNWPDKFKCLVNHDGVFDQRSMYYATEELWFPEREHGGPHYARDKAYEKHNPVRFVDKWKTPMLVVHGALDYRVPPTQGLAAFTALQRRGIESELLFFPDENHWVLRPNNSLQWHETVFGWLAKHLK